MFGYVRAFHPYMRVCEYDTYKGVYCGLCKTLGKEFGLVSRFTLSYDFTFLALMDMAVNNVQMTGEKQRCIAHPFKKSPCATCKAGLKYPAYSAMILVYHKIRDDLDDEGFLNKTLAFLALPFFKKPYKKSRMKYGKLANNIEKQMKFQREIEKLRTENLDLACEPTAKMMEAIFSELSKNKETKINLERFGYMLGRFIYLCDAVDDVKKDFESGNYNPLIYKCKVNKHMKELPQGEFEKLCTATQQSINFTLGELAEAYVKLDLKMYKPILDNIIYLGLPNVFEKIKEEKFNKGTKNDN